MFYMRKQQKHNLQLCIFSIGNSSFSISIYSFPFPHVVKILLSFLKSPFLAIYLFFKYLRFCHSHSVLWLCNGPTSPSSPYHTRWSSFHLLALLHHQHKDPTWFYQCCIFIAPILISRCITAMGSDGQNLFLSLTSSSFIVEEFQCAFTLYAQIANKVTFSMVLFILSHWLCIFSLDFSFWHNITCEYTSL